MQTSLLSLFIVVLIKELANIRPSTTTKALFTNQLAQISVSINININTYILREKSKSSISNRTKESSILSNMSSIPYHEKIEIQNNNPF